MLLTITPLYAALAGLLLAALTVNVTQAWVRVVVSQQDAPLRLQRAEKILQNFIEYVPLSLLLLLLLELRGAPAAILHGLGLLLLLARLGHALAAREFAGALLLRVVSTQLTLLVLLVACFGCLYLYLLAQPVPLPLLGTSLGRLGIN